MAKIRNPILFSKHFGIDRHIFDAEGIFDPILNVDTKLFIDPLLLDKSSHIIIKEQAAKELKQFYVNILSLLEESKKKGDFPYRAALNQLPAKEFNGTCLGYGVNSISGRSISKDNREKIINTADEIQKIGIKKPELFILLPLFEAGIGADTISDITTAAIHKALLKFTAKLAKKLGIKTLKHVVNGETIEIIRNPLSKKIYPILLLPRDILRSLPFASTWEEIEDAANFNVNLREKFNHYISMIWKAKTKKDKERQLASLMRNKDGINTLLEIIKQSKISPYNFATDEESVMFMQHALDIIAKNPLKLSIQSNSKDELRGIVLTIIEQFKFMIENKGVNTLLWKNKNKANNERTTQKIFFAVAYNYCKANDIDINPEMDSGTGNVDFKFSSGFSKRVIVEIKHSSNQNIVYGFSVQLELYKKSEETDCGYYVVIDVGGMGKKLDKLFGMYNDDVNKRADIIYIDGQLKPSASKRKPVKYDSTKTNTTNPDNMHEDSQ